MRPPRAFCSSVQLYTPCPRSAATALALAVALGCGGRSDDATSFDGEACAEDVACEGITAASTPVTSTPSAADTPSEDPPAGGAAPADASAAECALPDLDMPLDFIVNEFVNRTDQPLYLASENEACGVWPAYVEFQRDGEKVPIYEGDCVAACWEVTFSDYQSHGSGPDCAAYPPCGAPLRLVQPGAAIYQFVFPEYGTIHDVPGACFPDGVPSTCHATHTLPPGPYTLVARAYPALRCGDASCDCNPDSSGVCAGPGGEPPRGAGEVRSVAVAFQFDPNQLGPFARYEFF